MKILLCLLFVVTATFACSPWTSIPATGDVPPDIGQASQARKGHFLYIFGGLNEEIYTDSSSQTYNTFYNDVYRLNLNTGRWKLIEPCNNARPEARAFHAMWESDDAFYVGFGSQFEFSDRTQYLITYDDLWKFDYDTECWSIVTNNTGPSGRLGFAATSIDGNLVLNGGTPNGGSSLSDSWLYNGAWNSVPAVTPITGRFFHEAGIWENDQHQLVIIGGLQFTGSSFLFLQEVWTYDWYTDVWFNYTLCGTLPAQILMEIRANIYNDQAVIQATDTGGALPNIIPDTYVFDLNTGCWCKKNIPSQNRGPAIKRSSYTIHKDKLYMTLGWGYENDQQFYNHDLWVYDLNNGCSCQ